MPETRTSTLAPVRLRLLVLLFVLSGAASLIDQVVWLRFLRLTFGNTTYAAATLPAVFMGGLGLGATLFGRWAGRLRRPLLVYALLELAIGLFAIYSPSIFSLIDQAYVGMYRSLGSQPLLFASGRVVLATACSSIRALPGIRPPSSRPLRQKSGSRFEQHLSKSWI